MALLPISVGDVAPDFELPSSDLDANGKPGKVYKLSDFRDKKHVILVFYPLDFSPVCTTENQGFEKCLSVFMSENTQLFGISVDSAWTHNAFTRELHLSYPLLADFNPKGEVASRYGLYLEESGYTARATVIVGKDSKVIFVKVQQIPEPRSHAELLQFVKSLS